MKRKPVDSEMALSVGYDPQEQILEIEFRPNGEVWQYLEVPEELFERMMDNSIGQFFNQEIRGNYDERQVE